MCFLLCVSEFILTKLTINLSALTFGRQAWSEKLTVALLNIATVLQENAASCDLGYSEDSESATAKYLAWSE